MRKSLIVFFSLIICLTACVNDEPYPFPNQGQQIKSIELLHNQNENGQGTDASNMVVLKTLDAGEVPVFMDKLYALSTKHAGTPPPWGYGAYIAKVTYENGDIEMFGTLNIEFIKVGAQVTGIGEYVFTTDGIEALIAEYADIGASEE